MTGIVDWAAGRARMILAFVILSIAAGVAAYISLPKEGEPDIEVPALFISVPFPGISAEDSEKLLVEPLENELRDLDGLKTLTATAAEGYAGVALEFEFGWDKTQIMAEVREAVNSAEADFPDGAEQTSINEINFSEFPILVVSLSGEVPERMLSRLTKDLQDAIQGLTPVLEAGLAGQREEMVEVLIDPLRLESYDITAGELINVVTNNNMLVAAGRISADGGAFSVKIPSAFDGPEDVEALPIKTRGDRTVTLGEVADIRLTFQDRNGTARYNGERTLALQVVKRKGFNVIDTAALVRETVAARVADWPQPLQDAVRVDFSMDTSADVASMVGQLEASVLTAIALVMIVVLSALGLRSALLVGFAIPTSFLLCFALLAVFGIAVSNIVMFGLILAVGMLVDGAIVVVEYADKRVQAGTGPMTAYREAAKRMFWPVISSTATTLSAFLPMLFWPGVAGEFMGNLPVTLIFVLSASLIVALVYLPVVGGVAGRFSRHVSDWSKALRGATPLAVRLALLAPAAAGLFFGFVLLFGPGGPLPGAALFLVSWLAATVIGSSLVRERPEPVPDAGYRRTPFGRVIAAIAGNPVMPFVAIVAVAIAVTSVFGYYARNNNGVEFFVDVEPERAIAYVRARGNLSIEQKDALVREVEETIASTRGVASIFAFAGEGGLSQQPGATQPKDAVGQVQIELVDWQERYQWGPEGRGDAILARINDKLAQIPGIEAEISEAAQGPSQGKPVQLRVSGENWEQLKQAAAIARERFEANENLTEIEDTRPLPGIDWQIRVDTEAAGRFGADVATVGAMVQLVTRGLTLDTMRIPSSDEEVDIRARVPAPDRILATLDTLKVRTERGMVPLSNFISREPVDQLAEIERVDGTRYFDIKADVVPGSSPNAEIAGLTTWLEEQTPLPAGVSWEWTGDQEDQQESQQFLMKAFAGALALMFVILLAQFNSFYNAVLVLVAVVLSVTGSLIGMLVMGQPFSIIMTGTGIVALAGIVVNNNIVLIDTYQEYARYMPRVEAVIRTAEARIRPVLLTTITTMAGLAPMMFGLSLNFIDGGYSINAPTSLWWKQLATAVVFGLGVSTILTLVVTPALLAVRIWTVRGALGAVALAVSRLRGRESRAAEDWRLGRAAARTAAADMVWQDQPPALRLTHPSPPAAAE